MNQILPAEQVQTTTVTLYPSQREKVERYMRAFKIRKFSQAIQRLIDDMPDAWPNGAEKQDTNGGASAAGNIGA